MSHRKRCVCPSIPGLLLLSIGVLGACGGPGGKRVSPEEYQRIENQARAASVQDQASGSREQRGQDETLDERERELAEELAEARFAATELVHQREQLALKHASDEVSKALDLSRARLELEHARQSLTHFDAEGAPRRRAQDTLELTSANDRLLEQREELAQLELMYAGSELGQSTAEIVMERARRSIVRAEAALTLRQRASVELLEFELPRERELLLAEVAAHEVQLANAERALQLGVMARAAAERAIDHEEAGSGRRLERLGRERLRLESDRRDAERQRIGQAFGSGGA